MGTRKKHSRYFTIGVRYAFFFLVNTSEGYYETEDTLATRVADLNFIVLAFDILFVLVIVTDVS